MKFYVIASMVFLLSLSVAIINQLDVMNQDQYYGNQYYDAEWIDAIQSDAYKDQSFESSPVQNDQQTDFNSLSEFRITMTIIGNSLANATYSLPKMLKGFGVPGLFAVLLSIPVWFIYFIFIAQLLLRFSFDGTR
jgi:hypothetical protein